MVIILTILGFFMAKDTLKSMKFFAPIRSPNISSRTVLLWHPIYKTKQMISKEINEHCPYARCIITENRSILHDADAIVIETHRLYNLPKKQNGQVWIYMEMESPTFAPNGIKNWNNLFNWTMTYRRDSDIPLFYGGVIPKQDEEPLKKGNQNMSSRKDILWFVSHCHTPSKREIFIKTFQSNFSVDVFGRCGRQLNDKTYLQVPTSVSDKYKFYYAAENSHCRDYITEKAFKSYSSYIIPMVRGGANYGIYLPPSSFIDVNNFSSFDNIARFLKDVGNDEHAYSSYFDYKQHYHIVDHNGFQKQRYRNPYCELCRRIHEREKYKRVFNNIHDWWRGHDKGSSYFCRKEELVNLR